MVAPLFRKNIRPAIAAIALLTIHPLIKAQELAQSQRLMPIWSSDRLGDWQLHMQRYLIKSPGSQLWMIIEPSFTPASALELDCSWTKEDEPKPTGCILRSAETKAPTWMWATPPPPGGSFAFPARIKTSSHSAPVSPDAAQAFINAWIHMLRETRNPKGSEYVIGTDGVIFEFYGRWARWPGHGSYPLMGLTWSPQEGPTKMLVDLGEHLIAYTKASEKDRPALLMKCVEEAKAIQAYEYK